MSVRETTKLVEEASLSATHISDAQVLQQDGFAIQAVWVDLGGLAGTIKLQGSVNNSTWSDIDDTSVTLAGSGNNLWNLYDQNYQYVRVVLTRTGGDYALSVWYMDKGI